jgi:hypothetical protein
MSPKSSRGSRRKSVGATAPPLAKFTTNEVMSALRTEGFRITRRIIYHACDLGVVQRPPRAGNLRRWTPIHLEHLRYYCREHSRTQPPAVAAGRSA